MIFPSIYQRKRRWKLWLLLTAIAIGVFTMLYTNFLVRRLSEEERHKMQQFADANKLIISSSEELNSETLNYLLKIIRNNRTIPVVLIDEKGNINSATNFDTIKEKDPDFLKSDYMKKELEHMRLHNDSIKFYFDPSDSSRYNVLYYKESVILKQLRYYPFIQLSVITLFLVVAYLAFSASRRSEQNKVWLGMSKETAHQLGTPISSLMAWMEMIKSDREHIDPYLIDEMDKDLHRLSLVTERFSKIGSEPVLQEAPIATVVENALDYMRRRSSQKVHFNFNADGARDAICMINIPLFDWVVENLTKNAIDAMDGEGTITCTMKIYGKYVIIDFADTGKGLRKEQFNNIFKPGFTTKKRGWGMGLSLVKRIIEIYHEGKIGVRQSEIGKGTVFRIELKLKVTGTDQ
jgi:hypothetical protein